MPIYWKPNGGSWNNTGPSGFGELYDSDSCVAYKGYFLHSLLDDANGKKIVYKDICTLYSGGFQNGIMEGNFEVTVIAQQDWDMVTSIHGDQVAPGTKKQVVYSAGNPISESGSVDVQLNVNYERDDDGYFLSISIV